MALLQVCLRFANGYSDYKSESMEGRRAKGGGSVLDPARRMLSTKWVQVLLISCPIYRRFREGRHVDRQPRRICPCGITCIRVSLALTFSGQAWS